MVKAIFYLLKGGYKLEPRKVYGISLCECGTCILPVLGVQVDLPLPQPFLGEYVHLRRDVQGSWPEATSTTRNPVPEILTLTFLSFVVGRFGLWA